MHLRPVQGKDQNALMLISISFGNRCCKFDSEIVHYSALCWFPLAVENTTGTIPQLFHQVDGQTIQWS